MKTEKGNTKQSAKWYDRIFSKSIGGIIAIIAFLVFAVAIYVFLSFRSWEYTNILDEAKIAQFGDFIGGVVGTLLAFVAAILYYVALREQSRDVKINQTNLELQTTALNQQIEEFKAQKVELEETRKVYEEQTELFREQTLYYKTQAEEVKIQTSIAYGDLFSTNFYSLLEVFLSIQKNLAKSKVFENVYDELCKVCDSEQKKELANVVNSYIGIYQENRNLLSPYFKTIYRLLMLIHKDTKITRETKDEYAKILRSQLSDKEIVIIYYDYLSDLGKKAQTLSSEYRLLKHVDKLDKIEFGCLDHNYKNELSLFLKQISNVIIENVDKFKDIETEEDINISEQLCLFNLSTSYSLKINTNFSLSIIFDKNEFESQDKIGEDEFLQILLKNTYDVLFCEKFRFPKYDEINESTTKTSSNIEFKFSLLDITTI